MYYVYDGNTVILELEGNGAEKARNVYGRNLIARESDGEKAIYRYNGHGDVITIMGTDGTAISSYEYDEFGNETASTGTFDNPYRYAGYEYLDEVELYDLNARYYDPSIARFLTEDPYYNLGNRVMGVYEINVPDVYSIMQANALYAYCGNSPIKLIDPTGKWPEWIENEVSCSTLTFISYKQYPWMVSIAPVASLRIDYAIDQVEDNKDIINAVSEAYLVRADIMGAIIYKEQLTQSLPDSLANIDSQYVTKKPHSVGLAAIYPGLARSAWQYVNPDVYNSLPESDAELQLMLTDPDFNVQTLAASLRYIAGTFHDISLDELQTITDEQWKWILYDYNYANSYNEKVMEYIPSVQELLD